MLFSKTIKKIYLTIITIMRNNVLRSSNYGMLKPSKIVYMVTDRCNSRCVHCNIWQKNPVKDPLSLEEIKQFFSNKLFKNVDYILCTGGEPAVREDLLDIMIAIHESLPKAVIQLSTNGLLPDRILFVVKEGLARNMRLDVGVSLDGVGEAHDKLRGVKGNFEKVDYLIKQLVDLRKGYKEYLRVDLGIVISDLTFPNLNAVRDYAKSFNLNLVEAWYNECSFYSNIGRPIPRVHLQEAIMAKPESPMRELWLKYISSKKIKFPCFALYDFFVLKCNGDIVPCLSFWDRTIGNLRNGTPQEIWHGKAASDARKYVKKCSGCLNDWGLGWSLKAAFYPILLFYLRHPVIMIKKIIKS